jgi:energy-coupling factor transporter ATP-binding protein EcfA2
MAYIEQFTIDGLAGRTGPLTAVLNRDVNVFYGLNGSGKTTLLKILHSALSAQTEILEHLPFARARVKVYLNRYSKSFVRTFDQPQQTGPGEDTATTTPVIQGSLWQNIIQRPLPSFGARDYDLISAISAARPVWSSDSPEPDTKRLTSHDQGFIPISRLYRNVTTSTGANGYRI